HEVVVGAARRFGALGKQQAIEIAVIGHALAGLGLRIAGRARVGDERAERARPLSRLRFPVETVSLALGALETLRVLEYSGAAVSRIVFALGIEVGQAHLDRGELVSPDPAIEELVVSRVGIPEPPRAVGHER